MKIDRDFPGGNIIVEKTEDDTVYLRQDWSTSNEWWFYWSFRVQGAAGQKIRFVFNDKDVFSASGPCVSHDRKNWRWLGKKSIQQNGFTYEFTADENEVYFSFCPLYTEEHLRQYLSARPVIKQDVLCQSEKGREVEHLYLESAQGKWCVIFTARMHACETMGNYVLEGALDFWLGDAVEGAFLRENLDIHAIPFFDKDSVEQGEQGKNRKPHDHNRDFLDAPLYASTRALKEQAPAWRGKPGVFLDLHCPWIRGGRNEEIFFVGIPQPAQRELDRLMAIVQRSQKGPLKYDVRHTIAAGQEWNSGSSPTSARWAREGWKPLMAATLEMPYAMAGKQTVTPENTRAFGSDVARAIALYLQEL